MVLTQVTIRATATVLLLLVVVVFLSSSRPFPCEARRDSLPRGASIAVEDHATDVLLSPDGTFAAGLYGVSPTVFTFSVWFARAAGRTVVWSANRGRAPVHGARSRVALDGRRGALVLTDYDGEVVWNSTVANATAARARLHDSGNLAIEDASGNILWQSFDHPTDTLLPTQRIVAAGEAMVSAGKLLAAGFYSLRFSDYAMLSLVYDNHKMPSSIYWPNPYYSYWQNNRNIYYNFTREAFFDASGHFLSSDNATFDAADLGEGAGVRRRLTLDTDGNLRLYSLDETAGTWSVSWMAFVNPCVIHGVCGANAVCLYSPAPVCVCVPGYARADASDWTRGCQPTFNHTDGGGGRPRAMKLVALPHTDFWGFDINSSAHLSLHECTARCMSEPSCVVFEYKQGTGECYTKGLMFNGRTHPAHLGTAYLKVPADLDMPELHVHQWQTNGLAIEEDIAGCSGSSSSEFLLDVSDMSSSSSNNQGKSIWFYFYGFLSAIFVIEVFLIAMGCWIFSNKGVFRPSQVSVLEEGYRIVTSHFRAYRYSELERGTKKFNNKIGHGGSGIVYKGSLDDERVVAVKVLQDVSQSEDVFQAELSVIGRIYHMNLVRMWGFCSEGTHRILVYEYIENGSLAKVLFDRRDSSKFLGWKQRFNIALGVAKGLAYLHNECLEWIIHCDMKPENILLDEDMEPKITDFGLSKLLNRDGSGSEMSRIRGTRGYMAPEWVSSLPITEKVDVYSYGVVLLELVKGRRITEWVVDGKDGVETDVRSVVKMVVDKLDSKNESWIMDLIDDQFGGEFNHLQAQLVIKLAISCLEEDRNRRPSMKYIVQMLISAEDEAHAFT
uniref:Receptor-like serine/threonine-protein kinase n=1 Tax=Oryza rufipogon TaxID=4529 RepID=A0A0E0RDA9_ORYRU